MTDEKIRKVWAIIEGQRSEGIAALGPAQILELARRNSLELTPADIWHVASKSRMSHGAGEAMWVGSGS